MSSSILLPLIMTRPPELAKQSQDVGGGLWWRGPFASLSVGYMSAWGVLFERASIRWD